MTDSLLTRRLNSDYQKVRELISSSAGSIELIAVRGTPPDEYVVAYHCRGIKQVIGNKPVYTDFHKVHIHLPATYPRSKPFLTMQTPIFHPHIFDNQTVCIGDWKINESLDNLLLRVGAIIQYDPSYFNFDSPANRNAVTWAKANMSLFPLGRCNFKGESQSGGIQWTNLM
jgi:ubiquitin-protein ligase